MKRLPLAILMALFFGWLLWSVSVRQAALFAVGIGLGGVLASRRFGFTTGWRMLVEDKDPSGVFGQLLLLALAITMTVLFAQLSPTAAWLQVPYLLWLAFAAYLNAGVWLLNR